MLQDKVIVVVGGAGLIGQEFVKEIIRNNGYGIIADFDEKASIHLMNDIKKNLNTEKIDYKKIDITLKSQIIDFIEMIVKKYKKIDAVVNCAYPRNRNYGKRFEDVEYSDFSENLSLHVGGYFLICQQFFNFFKQQGYGNIINIASIYGVAIPRFEIYEQQNFTMPIEYVAIKSSIIHMTKYMAKYFKGYNIKVNCISPGGIRDEHSEKFLKDYGTYCLSKGMLDTNDLNGTLVYLLSDTSRYINGQNIIVDDGFCL